MATTEAFSRVKIDAQLRDVGWPIEDGRSVRYEHALPNGERADYVLCDRRGRPLAVLEAKRTSRSPIDGERQGRSYAEQLGVPYAFLANGEEVWFWEWRREAHPRKVATVFAQADLERRIAVEEVRREPLEIPIDRSIVDRDYQKRCIDTLCREISQGRRKLLVEMATGTGKTRLAIALIKRLLEAHTITRVLFVADRNQLAIQAEDAFSEHLPTYSSYRVPRTGQRFKPENQITIVTLQTMVNEYANYSAGYFDLILIDECHRSIYGKWRRVLDHFDGIKIGLTATPCVQADQDGLPDPEDEAFVHDTLRFFDLERPTFRYTLREAIGEGHLVPYRIYKAMTVKTAAEGGFEVRRGEIDWAALDPASREELDELFGAADTMVVDPTALERRFTVPERNRAMVREFRQVLEGGYTGRDGVRRAPQWGKTIVFAVTKRHAETLAHMLDAEFADRKPSPEVRYADFVVSGFGPEDTVDARTRIKRFTKEDFPQILVSVNMLDTGFDAPEVVNLVMARFTRSAILYRQMRGRGTRRADHIRKSAFTIFDFVGVTDHHRDDEDHPVGGPVVVAPGPKPPPTPRRLLLLDVDDRIDPHTRDWIVYDEDGTARLASADEVRADRLGLYFEAWLGEQELDSEQMRLLRMIESQIRADAADIERFELHRFALPPFSLKGGLGRARRVFGGQEQLEAVIDSLNRAVFDEPSGGPDVEDRPHVH
jgi:type I restriction enzyme, R subunit